MNRFPVYLLRVTACIVTNLLHGSMLGTFGYQGNCVSTQQANKPGTSNSFLHLSRSCVSVFLLRFSIGVQDSEEDGWISVFSPLGLRFQPPISRGCLVLPTPQLLFGGSCFSVLMRRRMVAFCHSQGNKSIRRSMLAGNLPLRSLVITVSYPWEFSCRAF